MIDALLYAVRDTIRGTRGLNLGKAECEIMDDGQPQPRCGDVFVAVHGGTVDSVADNQLDERYGFRVTLTMRLIKPLDRVGDQQIAVNVVRTIAEKTGFNAIADKLRKVLHMNWAMTVLQEQTPASANDNLAAWSGARSPANPGGQLVYGFCEPARYRGEESPKLVGGEWFAAVPEAKDVGIKAELRFEGARRFQPVTAAVGPFV